MEKLYEIHERGEYDLLVLDTPPSRNALDFLDAPRRLIQFIEGRSLRLFIRPTGFGARFAGAGHPVVFSVLRRVTGLDLIEDLSEFFAAMAGMVGGFRERAERVDDLLADEGTTFLVVSGPAGRADRRRPSTCAGSSRGAGCPSAACRQPRARRVRIRSRRRATPAPRSRSGRATTISPSASSAAADAAGRSPDATARTSSDLRRAHRRAPSDLEVPELGDEIHDLAGLRRSARHLFGEAGRLSRSAASRAARLAADRPVRLGPREQVLDARLDLLAVHRRPREVMKVLGAGREVHGRVAVDLVEPVGAAGSVGCGSSGRLLGGGSSSRT